MNPPNHPAATMKPTNYFPPAALESVSGATRDIGGEPWLEIRNVDAMPHFLISVVSACDLWMFAGSNASLTAGRTCPEHAVFPYRTVDKILAARSGGNLFCSMIVAGADGSRTLWEPWSECRGLPVRRNLYKHITGGGLIFEEILDPAGLVFRWQIGFSEEFGIVKKTSLTNPSGAAVSVRCLDGFQHILPPGVPMEMQDRKSYLALAYMRHELADGLAIYSVNSGITDRAEPAESLRYAAAWESGGEASATLISDGQIGAFRAGGPVATEFEARGLTGSHLALREFDLTPGSTTVWWSALDTWLDHPGLVKLRIALNEPASLPDRLEKSLADGLHALRRLIGEVDGWQLTGEPTIRPHHAANALFNAMRGGLPAAGNSVPAGDFAKFVASRNGEAAAAHAEWIAVLPPGLDVCGLRREADAHGDPDIRRLAGEYLPLTFGRRHGDPSRPWNRFAIDVRDRAGDPVLNYQGNWRDIFQNWEGLALSYPTFLPAMIGVFLNASTADGYNPYRIERGGGEWEVFDPEDPWSNIGYWGDHQINYLSRLVVLHERFFPGALLSRLAAADFVYTDVPYRIRPWEDLLKNPGDSIRFDGTRHEALLARAKALGNDGKLLRDAAGRVVRATLAEKFLVPVLAKLSNLAPGGGVWMNTQRPEWNDANNALAGWGLSLVTVCQLHRHLLVLRDIFAQSAACPLAAPVAEFMASLGALLAAEAATGAATADSRARGEFMESVGRAAETYRASAYAGLPGGRTDVPAAEIVGFLDSAAAVCRATILASKRSDGLFHSYNFLKFLDGQADVRNLDVMLEGQVAAIASGCVSAADVLGIVRALECGPLYRADQHSFRLYPDRTLAPILERNRIVAPERAPVLAEMGAACLIASPDASGTWHFQADLANAESLFALLNSLEADPAWAGAIRRDRPALLAMWEETFHHAGFTGRSAGMFGFEGLGSVYWHMVAKLVLALGECLVEASESGEPAGVLDELARAYRRVRSGLGFCKSPSEYSAFPSDPYSHTPAHAGAQQPGMTGQVKEEILFRFLELGVKIRDGRITFHQVLPHADDLLAGPATYSFLGKSGEWESMEIPSGSLAFTFCRTPVVWVADPAAPGVRVDYTDGRDPFFSQSHALSQEDTDAIISGSPAIGRVTVRRADSGNTPA